MMATISIDVAVPCNSRNEGKQRVMGALGESFRQVLTVVVMKKFQLHATRCITCMVGVPCCQCLVLKPILHLQWCALVLHHDGVVDA